MLALFQVVKLGKCGRHLYPTIDTFGMRRSNWTQFCLWWTCVGTNGFEVNTPISRRYQDQHNSSEIPDILGNVLFDGSQQDSALFVAASLDCAEESRALGRV